MKLDDIPGFIKTPEIKTVKDCIKILDIAEIKQSPMASSYFENTKAIKKLLDDRRLLFELVLSYLSSRHGINNSCMIPRHKLRESAEKAIKKITGKSWEELNVL